MRTGALALVAVLALVAAGCGGGSSKRRDEVATFINRVNQVERQLAVPVGRISRANRDFARRKATPAVVARRLRAAASDVDRLTRKLDAVETPADAVKLRTLLVAVAAREASLAREVASLALFLPSFTEALRPLATASKPLSATLKAKAKPEVKASALETYAAAVQGVVASLRALRPPAVFLPAYTGQTTTLEQVRKTALDLADALRSTKPRNLAVLLHRFNVAAVSNQSIAAQKAQIAAIEAYNGRIRSLAQLEVRVARERQRVQHLVG